MNTGPVAPGCLLQGLPCRAKGTLSAAAQRGSRGQTLRPRCVQARFRLGLVSRGHTWPSSSVFSPHRRSSDVAGYTEALWTGL